MCVSHVPSDNISRAFVQSCVAAGMPANPDFNGASREGTGFYQFMIRESNGPCTRGRASVTRCVGLPRDLTGLARR